MSNGVYTACSSFAGPGLLSGRWKWRAAANPQAFALIWVTVLPGFDANNRLSIDSGGSGGCVSGTRSLPVKRVLPALAPLG